MQRSKQCSEDLSTDSVELEGSLSSSADADDDDSDDTDSIVTVKEFVKAKTQESLRPTSMYSSIGDDYTNFEAEVNDLHLSSSSSPSPLLRLPAKPIQTFTRQTGNIFDEDDKVNRIYVVCLLFLYFAHLTQSKLQSEVPFISFKNFLSMEIHHFIPFQFTET